MQMKYMLVVLAMLTSVANAHDLTALPLGDGKIARAPKTGWLWPCRQQTNPNARGAEVDGPWIDKVNGTYDLTKKAIVPGNVSWPSSYRIQLVGDERVFTSNDLPSHGTGVFPTPANSEAYQYDRNPNRIQTQKIKVTLPANPVEANQPQCLGPAVGFLLSGSVLFNALDDPGRDAVAHETQDSCQGHPQIGGVYHYHSVSTCVDKQKRADGHSALVGYMLDGFGIYGRHGEDGQLLTSQDLDVCHGHQHAILWDGKQVDMYHYHATWDYPYTVGCMRGRYQMQDAMAIAGPPTAMRNQSQDGVGMSRGRDNPMSDRNRPPRPGGHPDLNQAASKLGISVEKLRRALGPPPPDLRAAAQQLGLSESALSAALESSR